MINVIKCKYCFKVFFDSGNKICPHCKKNNELDPLSDMFGADWISKIFGGGKQK